MEKGRAGQGRAGDGLGKDMGKMVEKRKDDQLRTGIRTNTRMDIDRSGEM